QISHTQTTARDPIQEGEIMLKLFNLVARELGPMFFKRGVLLIGRNLEKFFQKVPDRFWPGCRAAEIDGDPLDVNKLASIEWKQPLVFFKIKLEQR
ncbi:MAG: hypothetical protein KKH68_12245, partial [Proteobacteria bacterium]|nr:hypothetical protein [Pseudomonadota bacterium]